MNAQLKEELLIRKTIRRILAEESDKKNLLQEQEANLYSTFVGPFVDVVNAAKLTGLDVLSALKLTFDTMTTLSPKKIKAAQDAYDKRSAEIAKGWEPIEKRNAAAFSDHAAPLAFMLAPQLALGAAFGKGSAKAVPGVINYLDDAGWRLPLAGMIPGVQYDSMSDEKGASGAARSGQKKASSAEEGGLLTGLKNTAKEMANIFFITHYAAPGPMLTEKKTDKPGPPWGIEGYDDKAKDMKPLTKAQFDKELEAYLEETGIKDELEKRAQKFIESKKAHIEEIMETADQQLALVQALGSATSLEDFGAAIEEAKSLGLEVGDTSSIGPTLEEAAKKLIGEEEFIEQVKKEKNLKPEDEIPEEELLEAANTIVFMEAKKDIQQQLEAGLPELQKSVKEQIMQDVPEKGEKNFKAISSSPAGREYFKMIQDAIKEVEDYKIQA